MSDIARKRKRAKQDTGNRGTKERRLAGAAKLKLQPTTKPSPAHLQSDAKESAQNLVENVSERPRERHPKGVAKAPPESLTELPQQDHHMTPERAADIEAGKQMTVDLFRALAEHAAQRRVPFFCACRYGQATDIVFATVGRPKRWNLLPHEKQLPESTLAGKDDLVQLDASASQRLQEFCEAAAKQVRDHGVTPGVIEDFADVLRDVMKPLVESYLSGTLRFIESEEEKVELVPSQDQAFLVLMFSGVILVLKEHILNAEAAFNLALVCRIALSRAGDSTINVSPHKPMFAKDVTVDLNGDLLAMLIYMLESCAEMAKAGKLEVRVLRILIEIFDRLVASAYHDAIVKWLNSSYTFRLLAGPAAKVGRVSTLLKRIFNNIPVHRAFAVTGPRL